MFVLYEDSGDFKVGHVMQEAGGSLQVEAPHGKRSKIKANSVLLSFATPDHAELMPGAHALLPQFDPAFLWECAPQDEFDFLGFGEEYFGAKPDAIQATALLLALHAAPLYFHRKGRGRYKPAPPEILKAALAAAEKKRLAAQQQSDWADALLAGQAPAEIARVAAQLLAKPDKNSAEYKALALACERSHQTPEQVMMSAGIFADAHEMHRRLFEVVQFPRGVGFPAIDVPDPAQWPVADVAAFSIDDITTTEIDDAFSVMFNGGSSARIGIHIAAPGLLFGRGSALDDIARDRLSTVYMPGDKITMLPDALVEKATLAEGSTVAAVSLYVDVDIASGQLTGEPESRIERVPVARNLRHNLLDEKVTPEALEAMDLAAPDLPTLYTSAADAVDAEPFPCAAELALLWRVSRALSEQRDIARGKKDNAQRTDYNFHVIEGRIEITPRRRDAPLDLLVAEFMILANQTWGGLLHRHGIPGIYRTQPPGGRVRMATHAAPHAGLGVPQYAWSTSPLRRYVDLVNQWQLVSILQSQTPVFAPQDADLFAVVSAFDMTYKAYADFQSRMERYWCLRWLEQRGHTQVQTMVLRDDITRLTDIPLIVRLPGLSGHPRGTLLRIEVTEMDFVSIDIHGRLLEVLGHADDALGDDAEIEEAAEQESQALADGALQVQAEQAGAASAAPVAGAEDVTGGEPADDLAGGSAS